MQKRVENMNKYSGRPPSRGAWIEISPATVQSQKALVAPPRGGRGLKCIEGLWNGQASGRPPSRGAWIEISSAKADGRMEPVAPPRGGRGLK